MVGGAKSLSQQRRVNFFTPNTRMDSYTRYYTLHCTLYLLGRTARIQIFTPNTRVNSHTRYCTLHCTYLGAPLEYKYMVGYPSRKT